MADIRGRKLNLSDPDLILLWRKPFTDLMQFDNLDLSDEDQAVARNQMGQWLQAAVAFMMCDARVRLIEPYADRRLPKLFQLSAASEYFEVPDYLFSVSSVPQGYGPMLVAKPLGDPSAGDGKIFYTRLVNAKGLFHPYPWFLQKAIVDGTDVTCVYINGQVNFFECSFVRGETAIDWRIEINTENQSPWHRLDHSLANRWAVAVRKYMVKVDLHYGRLDFIRDDDVLYFLECNSNGQFGWLDDANGQPLHNQFIDAVLDSRTQIGWMHRVGVTDDA